MKRIGTEREQLWKGPRLVLIRHGQCELGAAGRLNGHLDYPLSPVGIEQRAMLPNRLRHHFGAGAISAVYSSSMIRAKMTATPTARMVGQEKPFVLPNYHERGLGLATGKTRQQLRGVFLPQELIHTSHTTYAFSKRHGMETGEEVTRRTTAVLGLVAAMHAPRETAVLVGHGDAMRGAIAGYMGWPLQQALQIPVGYTEGVVLDGGSVERLAV